MSCCITRYFLWVKGLGRGSIVLRRILYVLMIERKRICFSWTIMEYYVWLKWEDFFAHERSACERKELTDWACMKVEHWDFSCRSHIELWHSLTIMASNQKREKTKQSVEISKTNNNWKGRKWTKNHKQIERNDTIDGVETTVWGIVMSCWKKCTGVE